MRLAPIIMGRPMSAAAPFRPGWDLLPESSRSFALVIRRLPRRLDDAVMTSYLLCRIADTIEDSRLPAAEKRELLEGFAGSLDAGRFEPPAGLAAPAYRRLLSRTDEVVAGYRALDPAARRIIRERVGEMCSGMARWCDAEIRSFADQNEYCYYVAGLVGRLLTDLFHAFGHVGDRARAQLLEHATDFGLALQKVNIIRDLRGDLEDGRCYWPSEVLARQGLTRASVLRPENLGRSLRALDELVSEQWKYLGAALRYLTILPATELRLRIFCAIPLFMAVATVRACQGNPAVFLDPAGVKIPRHLVRSIVVRSFSLGSFNSYLQSWFRRWQRGLMDRVSPFQAVAALLP
jgi:farnesyl-diphosphate farnesyltransferase